MNTRIALILLAMGPAYVADPMPSFAQAPQGGANANVGGLDGSGGGGDSTCINFTEAAKSADAWKGSTNVVEFDRGRPPALPSTPSTGTKAGGFATPETSRVRPCGAQTFFLERLGRNAIAFDGGSKDAFFAFKLHQFLTGVFRDLVPRA